jgi:hypothetical protein
MSTTKSFFAKILPFRRKRPVAAAPSAELPMAVGMAPRMDIPRSSPRPVLVSIDDHLPDGRIGVSVYDPSHPGFVYDFWCEDAIDALTWVRQLGEKSWVTRDHLYVFATLILHELAPER